MMLMLKLKCLGGAREVGRNAFLLDNGRENILLDYGIKVEEGLMPLPTGKVDHLVIAHPHLDHSGAVPTQFRKGGPRVYATAACFDQAHLLWRDSMKISRLKGIPQLYTQMDIDNAEKNAQRVTFGQSVDTKSATIDFWDAGHVPGAFSCMVEMPKKKVFYTSDFRMSPTRLLNGAKFGKLKGVDTLIMESTYSDRDHQPREETEKGLINAVKDTVANGGIALVPVFAVGRAAEILLVLHSSKPDYPIYLDGMAREATEIALRYPELLRDPKALTEAVNNTTPLYTDEERTAALNRPCAIVTTGGMLEGGPVVFYLKRLHMRPECALLYTGFQAPRTAGRYLLDTNRFVTAEVDMAVKMRIDKFDFSAHAGRNELFDLVKKMSPNHVVCIHGDNCERFATELRGRFGVEAEAPKVGETIEF